MRRGLAFVIWLAAAAPAAALPGDPPIELRSPAAGGSLAAGGDLVYTCPTYRSADFGDGNAIINGEDAYTVLVATSDRLDGEGRLADVVARGTGVSRAEDPNLCYAPLEADLEPGPLFWQVSRICSQCSPQFEVSEVRAFELVPSSPPELVLPKRMYAGFPFIASVSVALRTGAEVAYERRSGSGWKRVGTAVAPSAATLALAAGRHTLRARSGTLVTEERTITVRSAKARRTKVRAGRWTGPSSAAFRVAGRRIRNLRVNVPLLCPTPGMVNPFTTQIATAAVRSIRLAPDGSFVGLSTDSGSVRVYGRLRRTKLTGGRVEMTLGTCAGSAKLSARPA